MFTTVALLALLALLAPQAPQATIRQKDQNINYSSSSILKLSVLYGGMVSTHTWSREGRVGGLESLKLTILPFILLLLLSFHFFRLSLPLVCVCCYERTGVRE